MRQWLLLCSAIAVAACSEKPQGTVSHGPEGAASAAARQLVRLVVEPGTPLSSQPVADAVRRRLAPLGLSDSDVEIAGADVHVYVGEALAVRARAALEGGRVDVLVADDAAPPAGEAEPGAPLAVESESVSMASGPVTVRYVTAPVAERQALVAHVATRGDTMRLGPLFRGSDEPSGYRTYAVLAKRGARGESVTRARALEEGQSVMLELGVTGGAKGLVAWQSKQRARFLLFANGEVLAAVQPEAPIEDGVLKFPIVARSSKAAALKVAHALAQELDGGRALANAVTVVRR